MRQISIPLRGQSITFDKVLQAGFPLHFAVQRSETEVKKRINMMLRTDLMDVVTDTFKDLLKTTIGVRYGELPAVGFPGPAFRSNHLLLSGFTAAALRKDDTGHGKLEELIKIANINKISRQIHIIFSIPPFEWIAGKSPPVQPTLEARE
jgi:hypothetical protein